MNLHTLLNLNWENILDDKKINDSKLKKEILTEQQEENKLIENKKNKYPDMEDCKSATVEVINDCIDTDFFNNKITILKSGEIFSSKIYEINNDKSKIGIYKRIDKNSYTAFIVDKGNIKILNYSPVREIDDVYDLLVDVLCNYSQKNIIINSGDILSAQLDDTNKNNIFTNKRISDNKNFNMCLDIDKVKILGLREGSWIQ
jgi:hypothetical protein